MLTVRLAMPTFSVTMMILSMGMVSGQTYPSRPIRMVTPAAGGGGDFTSRLIAQALTASVGWQVIVENRPSGLTAEIVSKATPDGYSLLLTGTTFWLLPFLQDNVPYDPIKDFSTITLATTSPNVIVVNTSLPVNSVKELIALAKAKPGALNYASGAAGASNHLAAELFKAMAGVNIVRIPYNGTGPAITAVIAGEAQVMFSTTGGVATHVKSGKLRALAVTSAQPSALIPGLPAAAAALPGYEAVNLQGVFVPAKTSPTIINRINQEIVRVLHEANVVERFRASGVESVGSSPVEFSTTIKSEMARLGKVIKDAGIRGE